MNSVHSEARYPQLVYPIYFAGIIGIPYLFRRRKQRLATTLPSMAGALLLSSFSLHCSSSLFFCQLSASKNLKFLIWDGKVADFRCKAHRKPSFVDQILDYIEGGPKLRKWYGAPDLFLKDGTIARYDDDPDVEEVRNAVLVTDGDGDIGQMVILSLIVKRIQVKALVKDKRAAMEAFGNYVESMVGDADNKTFQKKALRGVRAIICPNEGFLSKLDSLKGVQHIVVLSQLSVYKGANSIQALMKSNSRKLAEQDESMVMASGIPYTIIRVGVLQNTPGGTQGFNFEEVWGAFSPNSHHNIISD
ncbi:hypothetical protein Ancab_012598 [Ancistrocladus abbreviatus]